MEVAGKLSQCLSSNMLPTSKSLCESGNAPKVTLKWLAKSQQRSTSKPVTKSGQARRSSHSASELPWTGNLAGLGLSSDAGFHAQEVAWNERKILRHVGCQARASSEVLGNSAVTSNSQVLEVVAEGNGAAQLREDEDEAEVLIECRDVYKSFGDKHILSGASFKIRAGEAVGIIGPSGTGKSTVLRIMAGLLAPDAGEVVVCGKAREGLISDEQSSMLRIGLVFQSAALFDSLTVRENVGFMLYEHSDLAEAEIRELVQDSLAAVGLKGVEERLPSELSGGMKKRVALARAIISDSKTRKAEREVVMYDEPTAGLDPIASTVVEDLIRSLHIRQLPDGTQTGKIASYIVVTHQHSTIRRAVDRILFLHEGKVVWEGTTAEFDDTDNPIVRQFADGSLDGPIKY